MSRPCWIPPIATCPHCHETLRLIGGTAAIAQEVVTKFGQRHFNNCKSNPAAVAARKENDELLCISND